MRPLLRHASLTLAFAILCLFFAAEGAHAQGTDYYIPRPFPSVGVDIGGNAWDCSGESTAKFVDPSGNAYMMTNNHVAGFNNGGGNNFLQPWDCSGHLDCIFGSVYSYMPLVVCNQYNLGDAALIKMPDKKLASNTIYGFNKYISSKVVYAIDSKYVGIIDGGTGGLETGPIVLTGAAVFIDYTGTSNCQCQTACPASPNGQVPAGHCWAGILNTIIFQNPTSNSNPSLGPGTSGAMVFTTTDQCNNPVGQVFGGGTYNSQVVDVSAPILTAMQNLGVSINPVNTCVSSGWTAAN